MTLKSYIFIALFMFVSYCSNGQIIRDSITVKIHPKSEFSDILNRCDKILHFTNRKILDEVTTPKGEIDFLKQTLKKASLYRFAAFRCCNFIIQTGENKQHLAISEFIYKDESQAKDVYKYLVSKEKYSLSEVLILFKPLRTGRNVFIILSESPLDPGIQKVFKSY